MKFRIVNMPVGTKRVNGVSLKVTRASNGIDGVAEVDDNEATRIIQSASFKAGNIERLNEEDLQASINVANARAKLEAISLLFNSEEVESFNGVPKEAIEKIRSYAFEVRNFYLGTGEIDPVTDITDENTTEINTADTIKGEKAEEVSNAGEESKAVVIETDPKTVKMPEVKEDNTGEGTGEGTVPPAIIPAYEDITVSEIKETLEELGVKVTGNENKTVLYKKMTEALK